MNRAFRQARHMAAHHCCVNARGPRRIIAPGLCLGRSKFQQSPGPSELGAGEGNRTLVVSLEGFCSTIELHPLAHSAMPFGN